MQLTAVTFKCRTFKWSQAELDGIYLNARCCWAFKCPLLFGVVNNFKHFIKNAVSNTT
jgi:hypothetical protein